MDFFCVIFFLLLYYIRPHEWISLVRTLRPVTVSIDLAVLSLCADKHSKAVGTMHLERADGTLPSEEEMGEFEAFNRQLALLLDHCERTNLLLGGLDATKDPIVIVDARARDTRLPRRAASAGASGRDPGNR